MSRDELSARRADRAATRQVSIRVARGGFIVSHNEEIPPPSRGPMDYQQGGALGTPMPFIEGRETVCTTLEEVHAVVASLLGGTQ